MTQPTQPLNEQLKPCPFCGGEARVEEMPHSLRGIPDFAIDADHADDCPLAQAMAYVPAHFTEAEAIAAWNTRINEQPSALADEARLSAIKDGLDGWIGISDLDEAAQSVLTALNETRHD